MEKRIKHNIWSGNGKHQETKYTISEPEYMKELLQFLSCEYGFQIKDILPAKRGFYGETWDVQTESRKYYLKIDYWNHHKRSFQNSLPIVELMTDSEISLIPKIINTKDGHLYSSFRQGTIVVFEHIRGELSEDYSTAQLYDCLAKVYRLKANGLELEMETFGMERIDTFRSLQSLSELPIEVKTALAEKELLFSDIWN